MYFCCTRTEIEANQRKQNRQPSPPVGGSKKGGNPAGTRFPGAFDPQLLAFRILALRSPKGGSPVWQTMLGPPARCSFTKLFGGRVPLLKLTTEKGYPYSNLFAGGPRWTVCKVDQIL